MQPHEIWKYPLGPGENVLEMPSGAEILTVQVQGHQPVLWAKVIPNLPKEKRIIRVLATGEGFNGTGLKYISTFQIAGGSLIFHAFEL